MAHFADCIDYVLGNEGGFVNNPTDPGGATNFGITQDTLSRFRQNSCSVQDVRDLELPEAKGIYLDFYWTPLNVEHLESNAVATAIFDMAVNRGLTKAVKYAQQVITDYRIGIAVDGELGPATRSAIDAMHPALFLGGYAVKVMQGYDAIVAEHPTMQVFYAGWKNRALRIRTLVPA